MKVYISDESEKYLENRVDLICNLYKALTNRKLAIEFKPEEHYISIPKVKKKKIRKGNPNRNKKVQRD